MLAAAILHDIRKHGNDGFSVLRKINIYRCPNRANRQRERYRTYERVYRQACT